jgi:hypothetical protein
MWGIPQSLEPPSFRGLKEGTQGSHTLTSRDKVKMGAQRLYLGIVDPPQAQSPCSMLGIQSPRLSPIWPLGGPTPTPQRDKCPPPLGEETGKSPRHGNGRLCCITTPRSSHISRRQLMEKIEVSASWGRNMRNGSQRQHPTQQQQQLFLFSNCYYRGATVSTIGRPCVAAARPFTSVLRT